MAEMERAFKTLSDRLLAVGGLQMQEKLQQIKHEVADKEERVFSLLDQTARSFRPETSNKEQGNALRDVVDSIFDDFHDAILLWKEEMRERQEVRQKLEAEADKNMGARLIVVVFGRTNAGKSTLGNFLRGKQLREAAFDNAWKNGTIKPEPIRIIEKAKSDEKQLSVEWLAEGATETTTEAQLFDLPGFLWLDTPGFGSTNDESLGGLARKYVKRADLVIYLDHSDNPGLEDITEQFVTIMKEGRHALIAINQSDKQERCKGPDGKTIYIEKNGPEGPKKTPLKKPVAKSDDDRAKQEKYLTEVMESKLGGKKVEAISISTLLAGTAVKSNDDAMFAASNMRALFKRILDQISDDDRFIALKSRDAVQNCIALINRVIGEDESRGAREDRGDSPEEQPKKHPSLQAWDTRLMEMEERVEAAEKTFNLDAETGNITATIMLQARGPLRDLVDGAEKKRETSGEESGNFHARILDFFGGNSDASRKEERVPEIDINPLLEDCATEAGELMKQKAQKLLKDLWLKEGLAIRKEFARVERVRLQRRTERHEYEAFTTESYERDPEGIIEHVTSFFGRKHYGTRVRKYMKEQIIDLGYNTEEVYAELATRMEQELASFVKTGLEQIRDECLTRGLRMLRERRSVLMKTEEKLKLLRGELETRVNEYPQ